MIPFGILLPIYVFETSGSYLLTGAYASFTILLSIVANFAFRQGYRKDGPFAPAAVGVIILSSLVLFTRWDPPWDAFVFAGVYTVLSTPLNNMVMVEFMDRIDRSPGLERVTAWSNREFYLGIGRVVVLGSLILLASALVRQSVDLVLVLPFLSLYAVTYLGLVSFRGSERTGAAVLS